MNKCDNCGWTGPDDDVVQDGRIECEPGDIYPSGNCPECECNVFHYPDVIPCGFCGDNGYTLDREGLFEKCHHCDRFTQTWQALDFYTDNPPQDYPYDFNKFRLVLRPKPTGISQSPD